MDMTLCAPGMASTSIPLFERFAPSTLALISEAVYLRQRIRARVGIEEGVVWSFIRNVERGNLKCDVVSVVSSEEVEAAYSKRYVAVGHEDAAVGERKISMNIPTVVRHLSDKNRFANVHASADSISPGVFLSMILSEFNFQHSAGNPFRRRGISIRDLCAAIVVEGVTQSSEQLALRGTVAADRKELYEAACACARYVGGWLLCAEHVYAADPANPTICLEAGPRWRSTIERVRDHIADGGCTYPLAFPGRRPWAPSAMLAFTAER